MTLAGTVANGVVVLDQPGNGARPTRPVYLSTIVTCPNRGAITGSDEGCAG